MSSQIKLDSQTLIVSRTDTSGVIEYVNKDFSDISGYKPEELIHRPHNIIRHPDMPAVIFKLMWDRLKEEKDIFAVVKNLAKNGDYYWVTTHFEIRKHPYQNRVGGYVAHRRGASEHLVKEVSKLYEKLLIIEKSEGIRASEEYLSNFLDSKNMTYDEYIDKIALKESMFKSMFKKMFAN